MKTDGIRHSQLTEQKQFDLSWCRLCIGS